MSTAALILTAIGVFLTALSMGVAVGVSWMKESIKRQIGDLKNSLTASINAQGTAALNLKSEILEKIDSKLADFVRTQTFRDYVEAHGREHKGIDEEMGKLREFKHETNGLLRQFSANIDDLQKDVKGISERVQANEEAIAGVRDDQNRGSGPRKRRSS